MYPRVCTLFSLLYVLALFSFEKYLSYISHTLDPYFTIYSLYMYNFFCIFLLYALVVVVSYFFRDVHRRTKKASHTKNRRKLYVLPTAFSYHHSFLARSVLLLLVVSSVFWITDIFSIVAAAIPYTHTVYTTYHPLFNPKFRKVFFFFVVGSQRPKALRVLCVLFFSSMY